MKRQKQLLLIVCSILTCVAQPQVPSDHVHQEYYAGSNPCYDERGVAQRCVPDFINAAYNREVFVTNTCGVQQPTKYCVQSGHSGMQKSCEVCNDRVKDLRHPAKYLTDLNVPPNETWWQSETMLEGVQHPTMVNLTLHLGKTFDITYIRLKFHSPRPESFAIYKKSMDSEEWIAWQYYSASCRATYGVPEGATIMPAAEDTAMCTKEFSDISPISGADVVFSTLEGRPSADRFEESEILQDWVTATSIRIVLNRLNTFGDEVFRDEKVLQSYYYAISDFAVGGRCRCNGHASECVKSTGGGVERMLCRCEHNTDGDDCERCKPFYNNRPWQSASVSDANECLACECNGMSSRCQFDEKLYAETGQGGRCQGCSGNTRGIHCEECVEHHWRRADERHCVPCNCNPDGSESLQCNQTSGQCQCKPGIGGLQCDHCMAGYFEFTSSGCRDCGCHEAGSLDNTPWCDAQEGRCRCKTTVEGKQCDRCPPGHFNLDYDNEFGCTKCFCYGHFESCDKADGYFATNITSDFSKGRLGWMGEVGPGMHLVQAQQSERDEAIAVSDAGEGRKTYFVAPAAYTGDRRSSYNQFFVFTLRISTREPRDYSDDIIIEGANGNKMWTQIFAQDNPQPSAQEQTYKFRLHEDARFRWNPRMTTMDFMSVLANVSSIKIRGTYQSGDVGFLSNVLLTSATNTDENGQDLEHGKPVGWVESCACLPGHAGQFCEKCALGFKRTQKMAGAYSRCIPCECHTHADECDAESGKCHCTHHTDGDTCERCARGYYGNALTGAEDACKACPCPNGTACTLLQDGDPFCTECPDGYTGRYCDACNDGYYGDPLQDKPCQLCECSKNIDENAIGNCDQRTGECKKCVYHTAGFHCERCTAGYWGDALLDVVGESRDSICRSCQCYAPATIKPSADYDVLECRQEDGQCPCMPHARGQRCDECESGYYNITSGVGCEPCSCDALGSANSTCDLRSGQCRCKPGVTGRRCDRCAPRHYGFGPEGCSPCACEPIGIASGSDGSCDVVSGQCTCRPNVAGRRCDVCMENMFDLPRGCRQCGECYTLIQQRVNDHRAKILVLEDLLKEIMEHPVTVNDTNFDNQLEQVKKTIGELATDVTNSLDKDDTDLVGQVEELRQNLIDAEKLVDTVGNIITKTRETSAETGAVLERWERVKDSLYRDIERARTLLATDGVEAWTAAQAAADKYGAQSKQLSELASESRKLALVHEQAAAKIEETGQEAANLSARALKNANDAIYGSHQTSLEIQRLKERFADAELLYNETAQLAEEQVASAAGAMQSAADVFTNVDSLQLPSTDDETTGSAPALARRADELREEAQMAEKNALDERTNNEPVIRDADVEYLEAKHALEQVLAMQQQADAIMADLDAARARAVDARTAAEQTLTDANNTLNTLIGFDKLVADSRDAALAALANVPTVEAELAEADAQTDAAERALGNAHADAGDGERIAADAQKQAEDASKQATQMRQRAAATKDSAKNMKAEADELKTSVASELETIENYATQAGKDKQTATEAVAAATQAEKAAERANDTVTTAISKVKSILDKLKSLDEVSDDELDTLEAQLANAQKTLDDADLESKVERLKAAQAEQQLTINQYERDIDALGKEVTNIEAIKDSLPNKCFNVIKLEEGTALQ